RARVLLCGDSSVREGTPAMRPEPPQGVLDYIRVNSATYTREVIDRELQEAGHSQETIDAAWRATAIQVAAAPPQSVVNTVQFWVLLSLAACVGLTFLPILSSYVSSLLLALIPYDSSIYDSGNNGLELILFYLVP